MLLKNSWICFFILNYDLFSCCCESCRRTGKNEGISVIDSKGIDLNTNELEILIKQLESNKIKSKKFSKGYCNLLFKVNYKGKSLIYSKSYNGVLKARYNIDYIARNTFYGFFFSNNQPHIYNQYFQDFIEGETLDDFSSVFCAVNHYNDEHPEAKRYEIDRSIYNKLLIQAILFDTGDQGAQNQIYITKDDGNTIKIIDVAFIDLDFPIQYRMNNSVEFKYNSNIFNINKAEEKVDLSEDAQRELIKILDKDIDSFVRELQKNMSVIKDKSRYIKYIYKYNGGNVEGYTFKGCEKFDNLKIPIYSKKRSIDIFNKFPEDRLSLKLKEQVIPTQRLRYENNRVFVKPDNSSEFTEIDENEIVEVIIDNFEFEGGRFYVNKNGSRIDIDKISVDNHRCAVVDNSDIEILDFNGAMKETIKIYIEYILFKIKQAINSGAFNSVTNDLIRLKNKYQTYINNYR